MENGQWVGLGSQTFRARWRPSSLDLIFLSLASSALLACGCDDKGSGKGEPGEAAGSAGMLASSDGGASAERRRLTPNASGGAPADSEGAGLGHPGGEENASGGAPHGTSGSGNPDAGAAGLQTAGRSASGAGTGAAQTEGGRGGAPDTDVGTTGGTRTSASGGTAIDFGGMTESPGGANAVGTGGDGGSHSPSTLSGGGTGGATDTGDTGSGGTGGTGGTSTGGSTGSDAGGTATGGTASPPTGGAGAGGTGTSEGGTGGVASGGTSGGSGGLLAVGGAPGGGAPSGGSGGGTGGGNTGGTSNAVCGLLEASGGSSAGASAGMGGGGGVCEDTGTPAVHATAPTLLGQPCSSAGALACNGGDQNDVLLCQAGTWGVLTTCTSGERCDRDAGVCAPIVEDCLDRTASEAFCDGQQFKQCGPDRTSITEIRCCGACIAAGCEAPTCGDGHIQSGEDCDDGNDTVADGCEPDCTKSEVVAMVAGSAHTCALLRGGYVRCWGRNDQGQLGLGHSEDVSGSRPYQLGPVALEGEAVEIASGSNHVCARMVSGAVQCWGDNSVGQLGLGHTEDIGDDELPSAALSTVDLDAEAVEIAAGGRVSCARFVDDSMRCWGENDSGQLGLGHTANIGDNEAPDATNARVELGEAVRAIGTSGHHTCAILESNLLRCWGDNTFNQLGLGHTENVGDDELPTDVEPMDLTTHQLVAIKLSLARACALRDDGALQCFGYNGDGGLGFAMVWTDPAIRAEDLGATAFPWPVVDYAMGESHAFVQLQNVETRGWGVNESGQLATGTTRTVGDDEEVSQVPPLYFGEDGEGHPVYGTLVVAGGAHTCAYLNTGELRCWGNNSEGQLGFGCRSPMPTPFLGGTPETIPFALKTVELFQR